MPDERRALWIFPWDLLDSGITETIRRARDEWNLQAISLCTSYHSGKFLLPRRASEKTYLTGGSAVYFQPDVSAYTASSLRPVVTDREPLLDVLDQAADVCRALGVELRGWTVGLHNSRLGAAQPEASEENVFGDRYPWALCPANPDVRAYLTGLIRDLAQNHDLAAIDLESAGYHGLTHGHHHELIGITFGPIDEFLMGLCFCPHCLDRATSIGIDGQALKATVRETLDQRFRDEATARPTGSDALADVTNLLAEWPELRAFVEMRMATVVSLVEMIQSEALAGTATKLALTASTFSRGAENTWLEGMDLHGLAETGSEIILLSYFDDPAKVGRDVQIGRRLIGDADQVVVGLSLLAQATRNEADLRAKVEAAREQGVSKFSFYNYGFVSETRLGWLGTL